MSDCDRLLKRENIMKLILFCDTPESPDVLHI